MNVHILIVLSLTVIASCSETADHSKEPSFYQCPFRIFNNGAPATNDLGEVIYCDVKDVFCPNGFFCNGGHPDGRAVCCHIIGP